MNLENILVVAKEESDRGGKDWEFGISRCKLSYMKDREAWFAAVHGIANN